MPSSWPQPAVLKNLLSSPVGGEGKVKSDESTTTSHRVLALYKFVSPKIPKDSLPSLKTELETICRKYAARGTLLIAEEGINGTICYPFQSNLIPTTAIDEENQATGECDDSNEKFDEESRDYLLSYLQKKFDGSLRTRISIVDRSVFSRLKIKIKSEIVTMHWQGDKKYLSKTETNESCERGIGEDHQQFKGDQGNDDEGASSKPSSSSPCGPCCPTERVGEYVRPQEWNKLLMDPDTLVIDTRNEYEIDVGTFQNAINPHTQSFVEFPDWIKRNLVDSDKNVKETGNNAMEKKKKIAMFCTGGIRCEKATNAAMQLIPNDIPVYHLEGGILAYLDEISEEHSMFQGDCYVFDQRVAVTYNNKPSTTFRHKCHACRHPLSNLDLKRDDYKLGISCRYCVGQLTNKQEQRFAQRQRQMELALKQGRKHIHDPKDHCPGSKAKKVCI